MRLTRTRRDPPGRQRPKPELGHILSACPTASHFWLCLILGGATMFIADSRRRGLSKRDPGRRRLAAVAIVGMVVVAGGCVQLIVLSYHDERRQERERRAVVMKALDEAVRAERDVHRYKGSFTAAVRSELALRSPRLRALIDKGVEVEARPTADGQQVEISVVKCRNEHNCTRAETLLSADGTRRSIP